MNRAVAATNSADEIYGEGVYALTPLLKGWVLSHFLGHACVREISGEKMSTLCNTLWQNSSPIQSIKALLGGRKYTGVWYVWVEMTEKSLGIRYKKWKAAATHSVAK